MILHNDVRRTILAFPKKHLVNSYLKNKFSQYEEHFNNLKSVFPLKNVKVLHGIIDGNK